VIIEEIDLEQINSGTRTRLLNVHLAPGQVNQVRKIQIYVGKPTPESMRGDESYVPLFDNGLYHGDFTGRDRIQDGERTSLRKYGSLLQLECSSCEELKHHGNSLEKDTQSSKHSGEPLLVSADPLLWNKEHGTSGEFELWRHTLSTKGAEKWIRGLKGGDSVDLVMAEGFFVQDVAIFSKVGIKVFSTLV
jgi:hypothetical protein